MNIQNILTILRDLIYQARYSEAIRVLTHNSPEPINYIGKIAKQYIKTHSGNIKPKRRAFWRGLGNGDGQSIDSLSSLTSISGRGYGVMYRSSGNGYDIHIGQGNGYSYTQGNGHSWDYLYTTSCPWELKKP